MNDNRAAITKELVAILLIVVMLLGIGGLLVRNVVVAVRALDGPNPPAAAGDLGLADAVENALRDLAAKLLPSGQKTPPAAAPQPAPAKPPVPAAQKGPVTAVRFFAGDKLPPVQDRRYADQFTRSAGNIYLEISFNNKYHTINDASIPIVIQHYDPAGRMVAESKKTAQPKKEWKSAKFATILDTYKPGAWPNGRHTVKLIFDGEQAGEYSFTIQ